MDDNSGTDSFKGNAMLCDRLRAVESRLAAARDSSGNADVIDRAIRDLAAIRSELSGASLASGAGAGRAGQRHSQERMGTSEGVESQVDHERMARAISELKSGEFDVQG